MSSETTSKKESPSLQERLKMLDPYERVFFGGLLLVVLCLWGLIALTSEVMEGDTQSFDEQVLLFFREGDDLADPIGGGTWEEVGRDITALGGYAFMIIVLVGVSGFLALAGRRQMMRFLLLSVIGGYGVAMGLKEVFQRPRPSLVSHFSYVESSSFPSGHSMMSMVMFFTLGALLARICPTRKLKWYCMSFALVLSLLVGASRVYVGVHYPTDVLAGWTCGIIWATLTCLFASWLERKGVIGLHEKPEVEPPTKHQE